MNTNEALHHYEMAILELNSRLESKEIDLATYDNLKKISEEILVERLEKSINLKTY